MIVLFMFLSGLIAALLLTPASKWLASLVGAIDDPGELKVHEKAIPRFGGSALWAATMLPCVVGIFVVRPQIELRSLLPVIGGSTLMWLLGALEDAVGIAARVRFGVGMLLAAAAAVAVVSGVHGGIEVIVICMAALWLLGCANAMNMLDGLDGLAAGVSAIAAAGIGVVALLAGNVGCAVLTFALSGACLGFLRCNFRPACTFMGDGGSLFLGFTLAASVCMLSHGAPGKPAIPLVLGTIIALSVPVGDMLLAMLRRLLNHTSPFEGDRSHCYDQLRDRFGFSVVKAVLTMYAVAAVFALLGVGISRLTPGQAWIAAVGVVVLAAGGLLSGGFLRRGTDER